MSTNRAEIVMTAADRASAVINRISDRLDVLSQKSNLRKAFDRFGDTQALERVNKSLTKVAGNMKSVASYGAIAAGIVGAAFSKSVNAVDDFADSMANYGINGKQLVEISALRDYLGQFGVSTEDANAALLKLTGNMSEARAGSKEQAEAFQAAGISMSDLKKKTPTEVLKKMMDVFNGSDKAGAKLKILQALAGKSAVKMSEGLSQGTAAYEKYKKNAKNALLTEKDFADAGNAADSMTRISGLVIRAGQKMSAVAAPRLQAFLDRRESGLLELIPKLIDGVDKFIQSLDEEKIFAFLGDVGDMFLSIGSVFKQVHGFLGTTGTMVAVLAVIFAPAIGAVLSLLSLLPVLASMFAVVSMALAANPIVASLLLVALVAKVVYDNWDGIVGGLKAIWQSLGGVCSAVWELIAGAASLAINKISGWFAGLYNSWAGIVGGMKVIWGGLGEVFSAVWELIVGAASLAINKISGWFTGLYDSFMGVWGRIAQSFGEKISVITGMLPSWLKGGSLNVNMNSAPATVQTSAQTIANGSGKTEVGGRIKIELTGAPARVTQMSSANNKVPIDVSSGLYGVGA